MTTAGGYPSLEQRSAEADPLIIEGSGLNEWSRHNDKELSIQRNVLNLNNQHVRITLWSLVYLVIAFMQINANSYMYQFYDDEDLWNQDFAQDQMEYYSLAISSNSIIQFAVIILLCSWFCSCCRMNCNPCVGLLFIVGSIMVFSAMIDGMKTNFVYIHIHIHIHRQLTNYKQVHPKAVKIKIIQIKSS